MAGGELDATVPGVERNDEVGAIAKALVGFRDALGQRKAEEARLNAQMTETEKQTALARLADEFEATVGGLVRKLSHSSGTLEDTARSLSSTAERTNMQSASVASVAEQTAANVQAVATATEQACRFGPGDRLAGFADGDQVGGCRRSGPRNQQSRLGTL